MPALFLFLFKVNIALILFCLGYYLVLRHLTFYTLNRIYLVIAILFSTLYPNINLTDFAQRYQQLTGPVQTVILNWKVPAENFAKPLYQPNYWQWVEMIFWAGVVLFAVRLITQLFSLYKLYRQSKPGQVHDYPVRLIRDNIIPFSFWRSIYINPAKLSPADLKSVLEHEQVHVSQWHTLDILLAELSTIFYWFNPGVWLMKKAVRENIEFITDRKILQKGTDSKQYQYSLVSVSLATMPNTIVNHFNISTIKKRIIMMNAKRSAGYNLTRYVFLVPAVVASLLVFSLSKAASKKALHTTFKSIAGVITRATVINSQPQVAVPKANIIKKVKPRVTIKTQDTIYSGKSKDGKKSFIMMGGTNADSVNYVINGVKSTKAGLKAIDPGRIYSIEVLEAKAAKEFYPELDNDRRVLFVTTDDSEAGKKLKEKMDKAMGGGMIARNKSITIKSANGSADIAPIAESSGVSFSTTESSDDAPIAVEAGANTITSVVVTTDPKVNGKSKTWVKKNVTLAYAPKATVIVKNLDINTPVEANVDVETVVPPADVKAKIYTSNYTFNAKEPKTKLYISKIRTNDETTLDNPDMLFIIDGKEAKGMKNLSPAAIKSISILKDEAAEKKYGEKGKNGVVVITTKKGK
ncbi:MAG: hypothetical protein JWR54_2824 [Mucilaginibacter sp.]|nr:hypothetical protein [Mucilaginibacter sp.]